MEKRYLRAMTNSASECIAAISTPPGSGGLAVIRVSGPGSPELTDRLFSGDLAGAPSHRACYGFIRHEGEEIDEVLVTVFRAPRSFTGEDTVEISCHGSVYVQQRILEALIAEGARPAAPGEFSMRAFLNGRMDLAQAEAVADVIAAGNRRAHDLAMRQMKGGFSKAITELRDKLIHFASMIELELDFGEEDVEFADRNELTRLIDEIEHQLKPLIESFKLGNAIKHGIVTVIAGRPNAGKSTLLNALLNEERAIVSDIAGTTRDTIEEVLNIKGVAFRLIDTAGIREARDQIEAIGVEKTYAMIRNSAVLLYLYDQAELTPAEVLADLERLQYDPKRTVVVGNKVDLDTGATSGNNDLLKRYEVVEVSAKEGAGLEELTDALYNKVSDGGRNREDVIITNARHFKALKQTLNSLVVAREGIQTGLSGDIVAMDIRHAIRYLGEITGEITTDDLLDNIFSRFCIGK